MNEQYLALVIAVLFFSILLFLLLRAFYLWYFKINKRVKLEEEILDSLKRIEKLLEK